jgi:hypothetical protein
LEKELQLLGADSASAGLEFLPHFIEALFEILARSARLEGFKLIG